MTNTWWQNQLGYSKKELDQLTSIDITYPDDIEETREKVSRNLMMAKLTFTGLKSDL
jgi:hypothetical protein